MGLFKTECYKCGTLVKRGKKCLTCGHKLSDFGMKIEKCPSCKKWNTKENDSCWNCGFSFIGNQAQKNEINLEVDSVNENVKNIFCQECGTEIHDYANFCPECGTKIHSEKTAPKVDESKLINSSSMFNLEDFVNQATVNAENDTLLLKEYLSDIESIIKKYGSYEVKNEKELKEQIEEIDSQINIKKEILDRKLKILKSDMIQIEKIRDENKPSNIIYSVSLKERDNGFERLFTNSNNEKTKLKIFINKYDNDMLDSIDIPDIDFHSISLVKSKNKKFLVAYNDQYFVVNDGIRETVDGEIVFVNENELFLINSIKRPNDGKIAESGTFIINDWMSSENLSGTFYVFNSEAKVLINAKFNSNLGENGLSENGEYAVLETFQSNSNDSDKIFFFDINDKKLLWERKRDLGNIERFEFDTDENVLTVFYYDNGNYRYSFKGEFLDKSKLEKDRIIYANGYELFDIAKEKMKKLDYKYSNLSDYDEVLSYLIKASNQNISTYTKARVYRSIGEIYYNYDNINEALKNFEKALSYDPKVGVKRLYDKLKIQE